MISKLAKYEMHCVMCGIAFMTTRTDSRFCGEACRAIRKRNDKDPITRQASIHNKFSEVLYSLLHLRESPDAENSLNLISSLFDQITSITDSRNLGKLRLLNTKISSITKIKIDKKPSKALRAI